MGLNIDNIRENKYDHLMNNGLLKRVQEKYPEYQKPQFEERFDHLTPLIARSISKFLDSGETPNIEILGYSFEKLTQEFKLNPIGAFLTLDGLISNTDETLLALIEGNKDSNPPV